jgi:hypothetical protein
MTRTIEGFLDGCAKSRIKRSQPAAAPTWNAIRVTRRLSASICESSMCNCFFFAGRAAAGQGAQASDQFGEGKRPDQVIVGAQFQALDAVGDVYEARVLTTLTTQ